MRIKFLKKTGNVKDYSKPFEEGKEYDLEDKRAELAIKRGVAEPVKRESTQEKKSKKSIKK